MSHYFEDERIYQKSIAARFVNDVTICAVKDCVLPVTPGGDGIHCHSHGAFPRRVIDRLTQQEKRRIAIMFAEGATGQQVADVIGRGFTSNQMQTVRYHPSLPKIILEEDRPPGTETLCPIGLMKTADNRWATLYGPERGD